MEAPDRQEGVDTGLPSAGAEEIVTLRLPGGERLRVVLRLDRRGAGQSRLAAVETGRRTPDAPLPPLREALLREGVPPWLLPPPRPVQIAPRLLPPPRDSSIRWTK